MARFGQNGNYRFGFPQQANRALRFILFSIANLDAAATNGVPDVALTVFLHLISGACAMAKNRKALLSTGWYELRFAKGATLDRPGIYEWHIDGVGVYIGKFSAASRPTGAYTRNVENLLNGRPYRPSNPNGFRRIHHELADAFRLGLAVRLTILENPSDLNRRERELIAERGTLNGPRNS